jgi:hypothetical protein
MDVTLEPETTGHKLQRKLAESRFFFMSLTIHILLVVFAGGIVLYKAVNDPPDFVAEGGDGLIAQTDNLSAPQEQPVDSVPVETAQTDAPDISAPSLDVISTTASSNTFKVTANAPKINLNATGDLAKSTNAVVKGTAGGVGGLPGTMRGRMGSGRAAAAKATNMKDKSERAVLRGLEWLRKVQNADGSWGEKNKGAMTGLALLCFLGHGETNESQNYGLTVSKAVQWILDNGTKHEGRLGMEGSFSQPGVYEHGICTYALGEYYTMTKDERVVELFKQAIGHIVQGQSPAGGWMYRFDKSDNDLSVSGWQIQALKAAHLTGLNLPGVDGALDKSMDGLEKVWKDPDGEGYGYRGPKKKYSLTGVGILCRLFWKGDRGDVRKSMDWLLDETEKEDKQKPIRYKAESADLYAWYYHTQAALMFGGGAWQKWNRWFQDEICDVQNPDGSWPAPGGKQHGPQAEESMSGQVYRTTLCILMLEVFYRYMPTNKE